MTVVSTTSSSVRTLPPRIMDRCGGLLAECSSGGADTNMQRVAARPFLQVNGRHGAIQPSRQIRRCGDGVAPVLECGRGADGRAPSHLPARYQRRMRLRGLVRPSSTQEALQRRHPPSGCLAAHPRPRTSRARQAYTPGTAGNWNPAPTLVNAALTSSPPRTSRRRPITPARERARSRSRPATSPRPRAGKMVVTANIAGESTGPGHDHLAAHSRRGHEHRQPDRDHGASARTTISPSR